MVALQWAAERGGKTYGVFTQHLTPEDESRFQTEYETWWQEVTVRQTRHVEITPSADKFIIRDDGV